jgi:hypothetical protein
MNKITTTHYVKMSSCLSHFANQRCQGRAGFAFTGPKRRPLTEEAGGLGAAFPREGH